MDQDGAGSGNVYTVFASCRPTIRYFTRNSTNLPAISSRGDISSAAPMSATAFGIPYMSEVSLSWAMVLPPQSFIYFMPFAPSLPIPVNMTPIVFFPYTSATENMVTSTEGRTKFKAIAVASDEPDYTPPCGACRQVLMDLAGNIDFIMVNGRGAARVLKLNSLLPHAFGQKNLERTKKRRH